MTSCFPSSSNHWRRACERNVKTSVLFCFVFANSEEILPVSWYHSHWCYATTYSLSTPCLYTTFQGVCDTPVTHQVDVQDIMELCTCMAWSSYEHSSNISAVAGLSICPMAAPSRITQAKHSAWHCSMQSCFSNKWEGHSLCPGGWSTWLILMTKELV